LTDRSRLRLVVLGVLVISLVMTLIGRLWYLQVLAAPQYVAAAKDNQIRDIVTEAPRGEIVDDKGRPLVDNRTALVISVDRLALDRLPKQRQITVLHRLSRLLHKSYTYLDNRTTPCVYKRHHGKIAATPKHCWAGEPSQPVPVSKVKPSLAATKQALQIDELQEKFPAVSAQLTAVRHYPKPLGAEASTILGYTAPISAPQLAALPAAKQDIERNTTVGVTGLEQQYEKYLHGKPGIKKITVDHLGAQTGTVKNTEPRQGDDLVTYLDAKAQATLEQQVQAAINAARPSFTADYAAGVVLDTRNGGIVAMASEPTYDPAKPPPTLTKVQYERIQHQQGHPFVDKAYASTNPPGSTFKPISASGLLYDGTMSINGSYDCPTNFGTRQNFDGESGKGFISLHEALVISCDTFFFALGAHDWARDDQLIKSGHKPREGVQHVARAYGYGENPGVDLPGAAYGHIADRYNTKLFWQQNAHKGLNYCKGAARRPKGSYVQQLDAEFCQTGYIFEPGDQENQDVGQGTVLASPLQVAAAYAAIANGGKVFEPRVVKAIVSPSGHLVKRIKAPVRDHLPISKADLDYIRAALYGVVAEPTGTAHGAFSGFPLGQVQVGGKTGTAELSGTSQNGTWFASFGGPAGQQPQYVTVIEVDKADQGAISSAPFVRNMWDALYGFGGKSAIFKNGVPPKRLPKVGAARIKQLVARRAARRKHQRKLARQQSQLPGATTTTTPTPNATTTP
jgi:penicillin-binding protein 2